MTTRSQSTNTRLASPAQTVDALDRVLASQTFANAPRLSRFLRYVVERKLAGDETGAKEYSIALDVFDRDSSFDPRLDTIVRVQARRLRRRLEHYYENEGREEQLRIEIPKGGYSPQFELETAALPPRPNSLPIPRNRLIGRDEELQSLGPLLARPDVRLVTVSGPGGSGKTRLAIEAVAGLAESFPGGIYWVELASLRNRAQLAAALAEAFGVRGRGGHPVEQVLCERLGRTIVRPALLALDNFEQLIGEADLVSMLLDACGDLTVLVTSRMLLRLYGEHDFPASPLPVSRPRKDFAYEELASSPAAELFAERAAAARQGFRLNAQNVQTVAEICFRLDGLPLAIELAAARSKVLSPELLLERLAKPLDLLTGGPRDAPDRHRTLRAAIAWSYDSLAEPEKKLLRRAALFADAFSVEAAQAVADAYQDLGGAVEDVASSLIDHNLLHLVERPGDSRPFAILETIREFALEMLAASEEEATYRRAHAAYFLVLAEEGEQKRDETDREQWTAACSREHANFEAALDWLLEAGATNWFTRMAFALCQYWERRERLDEGRARLETVLAFDGLSKPNSARAATFAGAFRSLQGDVDGALEAHLRAFRAYVELDNPKGVAREANSLAVGYRFSGCLREAREMLEVCLEACRQLGDPNQIAASISNLGGLAQEQGRFEEADSLEREAQSMFREIGNWVGVAWSLNHLGDQARGRGEHDEARERYAEALELFQSLGDGWGQGRTLHDTAELASSQGDFQEAHRLLRQALHVFAELAHHRGIAKVLDSLAVMLSQQDEPVAAFELAGAAAAIRETLGADPSPWLRADRAKLEGALDDARTRLLPAEEREAWERGRTMSLDQAIMFARSWGADAGDG